MLITSDNIYYVNFRNKSLDRRPHSHPQHYWVPSPHTRGGAFGVIRELLLVGGPAYCAKEFSNGRQYVDAVQIHAAQALTQKPDLLGSAF